MFSLSLVLFQMDSNSFIEWVAFAVVKPFLLHIHFINFQELGTPKEGVP